MLTLYSLEITPNLNGMPDNDVKETNGVSGNQIAANIFCFN